MALVVLCYPLVGRELHKTHVFFIPEGTTLDQLWDLLWQ